MTLEEQAERRERVIAALKAGESYGVIAQREGTTRNAICGIAKRWRDKGKALPVAAKKIVLKYERKAPPKRPLLRPQSKPRIAPRASNDPAVLAAAALITQAKQREAANRAMRYARTL